MPRFSIFSFLSRHSLSFSSCFSQSQRAVCLSASLCLHIHTLYFFVSISKPPGPRSSRGSLKPAWIKRSWTSWMSSCSGACPRARRVSKPTGKTFLRNLMVFTACQIRSSRTTTPSPDWAWHELPAHYRETPVTPAAGQCRSIFSFAGFGRAWGKLSVNKYVTFQ